MYQRRTRLIVGKGLAAICLLAAAPLALAGHVDTDYGVANGLGDGNNSNNYLHPYTDGEVEWPKGNVLYQIYTRRATGPVGASTGWKSISYVQCSWCYNMSHLHDESSAVTSTEADECRYYILLRVDSGGDPQAFVYVNHDHAHHNFCG